MILFQLRNPKNVIIAANNTVIAHVEAKEAAATLLCVFFIYHLEYTTGYHNFYRLLERVFFNKSPPRGLNLQRLGHVLSKLYPAH